MFGAFRATRILCDGRKFYQEKRLGLLRATRTTRRNKKARFAIMQRNAEVLREGERLLAIQLVVDRKMAEVRTRMHGAAAASTDGDMSHTDAGDAKQPVGLQQLLSSASGQQRTSAAASAPSSPAS
mmetsp:Transcript_9542/g.16528  ORF Transcript_9542/g.16528 Transcript_9542/m.16528 type:complete len:126 (+) Transcript_9542:97-474(+)